MATQDPLSELLSPKTINGGLPALVRVPDPVAGAVNVDDIEGTTARLFALLGVIVRRDTQLVRTVDSSTTNVDSPEWSEAFRKVTTFVAWILKDEQVREKFLSEAIDKPSAVSFARFIGSPEEPGLADVVKLERTLIFSFLLGLMMSRTAALISGTLNSILPTRPENVVLDMISSLTSIANGRGDPHFGAAEGVGDQLQARGHRDVTRREGGHWPQGRSTYIELNFAYWAHGVGQDAVGAATGRIGGWYGRTSARLGAA